MFKVSLIKKITLTLLIVVIGILIVSRLWSGDNTDNLIGGCLISHGALIYKDFFSHHAPLSYYLVALVDKITGSCSYIFPQLFFYTFYIGCILLLLNYTKSYLSAIFLLFTYGSLGEVYGSTFVMAESWLAGVTILIFILLFFHKSINRVLFWVIFIIVQFSIPASMPLYFPVTILLFIYFTIKERRKIFYLFFASFLPFFTFLLFISITNYYHYAFLFNTTYYVPYSGTLLQQYTSFFSSTFSVIIQLFTSFDVYKHRDTYAFIFSTFILLTWFYLHIMQRKQIYGKNKLLFYFNLLIFLSLTLHPGGFHMYPLFIFALTELLFIFQILKINRLQFTVLSILFLLLFRLFVTELSIFYFHGDYDPSRTQYVKFILSHSKKEDRILFYPYQNELYLLTNRLPGSYYYFLYPWIAEQPNAQDIVIRNIKKEKPKIIIIDNVSLVLGKYSALEFLSKLENNLENNKNYKNLSKNNSVLMYVEN